MSQAHRPTWNPTMGKETKAGSQQISKLSLASHTKLKFRQPGQVTTSDVARRDLRAELAAAERAAQDKKRKAAGLPPLPPLAGAAAIENGESEDEERAKRRRILEEAAELDADDSDEEEEDGDKGKGKAPAVGEDDDDDDDDDDDSDDDSDDEDDTAALMAELARIKQERAEEKARLDAEANASAQADRDEEIATGNPLLNLQAALGQHPSDTPSSSSTGSFAVKRRWDDDLIFKNQAAGINDKPKKGEFVNDLLRSEFHKKFMNRFIK
ncbi:complexed with cef1p [Vanrija albida]|uniref:Complexed with cef1p n=1 Tax=Vanrija albida TaxID=181172 RepID=A0ABR3PU21_9TREE